MQAAEELKVYSTEIKDDAAAPDDNTTTSDAVEQLELGDATPFTLGIKKYSNLVTTVIHERFKKYAYDKCSDLGLKIGSISKFKGGGVSPSEIVTTCNVLLKALGRKIKEENPYIGRGVMGIHDTLEASRTSRLYLILSDTEVTRRYIRYLKYLVNKSNTPLHIEQESIPRVHVRGQDLSAICDALNMRPEDTLLGVTLDLSSTRYHRYTYNHSPEVQKIIESSNILSSRTTPNICPYLYMHLDKVYKSLTVSLRKLLCFQTSPQ